LRKNLSLKEWIKIINEVRTCEKMSTNDFKFFKPNNTKKSYLRCLIVCILLLNLNALDDKIEEEIEPNVIK
jgi:thermostable 8-oxoguanine DNA glycosylase